MPTVKSLFCILFRKFDITNFDKTKFSEANYTNVSMKIYWIYILPEIFNGESRLSDDGTKSASWNLLSGRWYNNRVPFFVIFLMTASLRDEFESKFEKSLDNLGRR